MLERVVNADYKENKLNFASQPPNLDNILPRTSMGGDIRLSQDLITPAMTGNPILSLFDRPFTELGAFAATVETTYFVGLVGLHVNCRDRSAEEKDEDTSKLDAALHSMSRTLIPPPGCSIGQYCGAYAMRTLSVTSSSFHYSSNKTSTIAHISVCIFTS